MLILILDSKMDRVVVTDTRLDYDGSISIDREVMSAAGLYPFDQVAVSNVETGATFVTYVIEAEAGSREIAINGAAARLVEIGDRIVVRGFGYRDRGTL